MRKSFLYLLMSVVTLIGLGTLNSCKDYEEDLMREFNTKLEAEDATIRDLLEKCHKTCEASIQALRDEMKEADSELQANLDAAVSRLEEADDAIMEALSDACEDLYNALNIVEANLREADRILEGKIDGLSVQIDGLSVQIDGLSVQLNGLESKVGDAIEKAGDAYNKAEDAYNKAEDAYNKAHEEVELVGKNLEATQNDLKKAQDDLKKAQEDLEKAQEDIERTQGDLLKAKEVYDEAIALLQKRADGLEDRVINLESAVLELKEAYDSADKALQEEINALNAKIDALVEKLEKVEQSQKALVTSIELNAVVNPIFGTFNLPADVRSNALIGYYGKAVAGGQFPSTSSDGLYVDENNALTVADFNLVNPANFYDYKNGDILVNGGDALNIGTLYVTVNPTKADFTGTNFELVNSNDEDAKAKLGDLQPSDYKIQFGYTRAAAAGESKNGFYETQVSIAKADVEEAAIHSEGMANAAKAILDKVKGASVSIDRNGYISYTNGTELNISDLAVTILDNMSGVTDAYAVRASWADDLVGERSVYSQYGLAATAMKSFTGYASFKDFNYQTLPGYERALNFIDRVAAGVKNQIRNAMPDGVKDGLSVNLPDITKITIDLDQEKLEKDFDIYIELTFDLELYGKDVKFEPSEDKTYLLIYDKDDNVIGRVPFGEIHDKGNGVYEIKVKSSERNLAGPIQDVVKAVEDAIASAQGDVNEAVDKFMEDVNALLAEINNMEDKIDTGVDKFASILQRWLKKANARIVDFINSANYRLQPILVATNDNGTKLLSRVKNYPTIIPASTELILTNYTGEILAPALKKYVACTNVYKNGESAHDNADCESALTKVNGGEDLNKVLDGSVVRISAEGFQSGYTYELTIAALDYEGQQTARKFYVTVK